MGERVVIGGFSQGGAMALHTALTYPYKLGACVVLSGLLLGADCLDQHMHSDAQGLEVFWGHGSDDGVLEPSLQDEGVRILTDAGVKVTSKRYPMAHCSHPQEMSDLSSFLKPRLCPTSPAR